MLHVNIIIFACSYANINKLLVDMIYPACMEGGGG